MVHVCQMKEQERMLKILRIMSKKGKFIEEAKHAVEKCARQKSKNLKSTYIALNAKLC